MFLLGVNSRFQINELTQNVSCELDSSHINQHELLPLWRKHTRDDRIGIRRVRDSSQVRYRILRPSPPVLRTATTQVLLLQNHLQ